MHRLWATQEARQTATANALPFLPWAERYHRTHKGLTLDFAGLPWLRDLYADTSPSLVIRKSAQVGVTEFLTAKAFYLAEKGQSGLYVMPITLGMYTFVQNRVNRSILSSSYYTSLVQHAKGSDSTALKHIGAGALKFVGSNSPSSFIEFPADFVMIDEYDRCDQDNIQMAYDRLKATFGERETIRMEASTPTFPDYGIDARYKASDQREVMVPCPTCGEWQVIDWFTNVVEEVAGEYRLRDAQWMPDCGRDVRSFCGFCGEPWEDRAALLLRGRLEKQNPSAKLAGYFPHRLLDPKTPLATLWTNPEQKGFHDARGDASKLMVCYNSDLGLPYRPEGAGISVDDLNGCRGEFLLPSSLPAGAGTVTAGVDVGKRYLHVRISSYPNDVRTAAYIGTVSNFSDLKGLFARYQVTLAVIDLNPETHKVRELQEEIPFLYACQFVRDMNSRGIEVRTEEPTRTISIDRTMICDRLVATYKVKECRLPVNAETLDSGQYYRHMTCPIRIEQESKGQRYAVWTERNSGRDDYFFAEVYDLVASLSDYNQPVGFARLSGV